MKFLGETSQKILVWLELLKDDDFRFAVTNEFKEDVSLLRRSIREVFNLLNESNQVTCRSSRKRETAKFLNNCVRAIDSIFSNGGKNEGTAAANFRVRTLLLRFVNGSLIYGRVNEPSMSDKQFLTELELAIKSLMSPENVDEASQWIPAEHENIKFLINLTTLVYEHSHQVTCQMIENLNESERMITFRLQALSNVQVDDKCKKYANQYINSLRDVKIQQAHLLNELICNETSVAQDVTLASYFKTYNSIETYNKGTLINLKFATTVNACVQSSFADSKTNHIEQKLARKLIQTEILENVVELNESARSLCETKEESKSSDEEDMDDLFLSRSVTTVDSTD